MSYILNLKIELHNITKDTNLVSAYLQKIKESKGKLPTVDANIDNEELLHIALNGLPKEFHALCWAIKTRKESHSWKLRALLQVEEQSMNKLAQSCKDQNPMDMFFPK